jgi:hypothetical protein
MAHVPPPPWLAARLAQQQGATAAAAAQATQAPAEPAQPAQERATAPPGVLRGPGGRWLPGVSPNPHGKVAGTPDARYALRQRLNGAAEGITEVVIGAALNGNLEACAMVLSRAVAPLRPQGRHVQFRFDMGASFVTQAQQLANAVAEGHLTVEEGALLMQALTAAAGLKSIDEMEARLRELEGRAVKAARTFGAGMVIGTVDEKGNLQ